MQTSRKYLHIVLSAIVVVALAGLQSCAGTTTQATQRSEDRWIGVWGSSAAANAPNGQAFNNQTLRLIAHSSFGGDEIRIRIANTYGTKSLAIGATGVALQSADAGIQTGTHRAVTFGGRASTSIPPGAVIVSDPISLKIAAQTNLSVSLFLPSDTGPATAHPGANQISYASGAGNFVATLEPTPFATQLQSWPILAGIEVRAGSRDRTIVTFGDSITDGYKSTVGANKRWPDFFTARMHAAGKKVAVVNAGISGNRLLHDSAGGSPRFGPNALSRFDRDALTVSGTTHVVTLIGINDIGMGSPARSPDEVVSAEEIIAAHEQLIVRTHARGLKIIGATLTPFRGAAYFTEEGEKKREAVNAWIRANKNYDGVIDFDKATLDPQKPSQLLAAYDSGDHLHPNDAGYKAMADAVDLRLFD